LTKQQKAVEVAKKSANFLKKKKKHFLLKKLSIFKKDTIEKI
jgi:hypothetical protein